MAAIIQVGDASRSTFWTTWILFDMRVLPIQEAWTRKFARRAEVKEIQLDVSGHCAHLGGISPGCYPCFGLALTWGVRLGEDAGLPNVCNRDCVNCFRDRIVQDDYAPPSGWTLSQQAKDEILQYFLPFNRLAKEFVVYTFSGISEPLFYLPVIRQYLHYLRETIEKDILPVQGWAKIYTNGIRLDKAAVRQLADMGIQEVRVNLSASGFSAEVFHHLDEAVRRIPVVTVEVPSWPPARAKLLEMLPRIDAIGVKHLNICQVEIMTREGLRRIVQALPEGEVYQGRWMMLDDGGMVEEIIREVAENKYRFSVLDCGAFVKQIYENACYKELSGELNATPSLSELCGMGPDRTNPESTRAPTQPPDRVPGTGAELQESSSVSTGWRK